MYNATYNGQLTGKIVINLNLPQSGVINLPSGLSWYIDSSPPIIEDEDGIRLRVAAKITVVNKIENLSHVLTMEEKLALYRIMPYTYRSKSLPFGILLLQWLADDELTFRFKNKTYETIPTIKHGKGKISRDTNRRAKAYNRLGASWRKDTAHRKSL